MTDVDGRESFDRAEGAQPRRRVVPGRAALGLLAGALGTLAMTVAMKAMFRLLPRHEQYPLPPRQITTHAAERVGASDRLDAHEVRALTLALHLGYGTLIGSLYQPVTGPWRRPSVWRGTAFGLGVWLVGYLGWVPLLGFLPPATRLAPHRNVLMITAHLVWGLTIALLFEAWTTRRNEGRAAAR